MQGSAYGVDVTWAIILHGGAKEIDSDEVEAHCAGCVHALETGRRVLMGDGVAIDAVEAAIRELESNPTFNAGFGSALNADGEVEMCAAIMEGADFNIGAVAVIMGVKHPISVARAMLMEDAVLLAADGAHRFAVEKGCETCDPHDLIPDCSAGKPAGSHDTVGCIALDTKGRMAVGTSTGGLDGCKVGRVGDSPLPGCGYYVDNTVGGVAFSGDGEQIARKMLAARVMQSLATASPNASLLAAMRDVAAIGGEAGGIVLTPRGTFGWQHNSQDFAVAFQSSSMDAPLVHTNKQEADQ